MDDLANRVRTALETADLEAFADLLHPAVRWGAPGDGAPPCTTRDDVLAWYARGRADGRRATVSEVLALPGRLVVGMEVSPGRRGGGGPGRRWQVLTVTGGRITDIRGYGDRLSAVAAAGG